MTRFRGFSAATLVCAAGLLLVWTIFLMRAELSWRRAESLMSAGEPIAAGSAARGVFDLYVPGSPRLEDASHLIWNAARAQEAGGNGDGALAAYRELRSAWIGAAPLGGDGGWIARCEERIARLGEEGAHATMRAPTRPNGFWGVVGALSFAAWICAAVGLIAGGIRRDGRLRLAALGWAGVLVAGYAVWILGLMRA
ncbi:MAG: hypothetical protein Q8R92_05150 [Deltaproteobacteria bacterium]|nr:hypothetical protein [Deltaproteobacteria bacterium]